MSVRLNPNLLLYQPQVDETGKVRSSEALLRWQQAGGEIVNPSDFIPVAEKTGLIIAIGRWVLEAACVTLQHWAENAKTSAINIRARQFRHPLFYDTVCQVLQCFQVNPARLELELTESVVIDDLNDANAKIQKISLRRDRLIGDLSDKAILDSFLSG